MKKHILLLATSIVILSNSYAQYDSTIWQVIDETTQVQALTGLNPSHGIYELEPRDSIYNTSWNSDVLHIDFTNPVGDNWADFGFMFVQWKGETGNRFTKTPLGISQNSDTAKGFTVDFTDEANRLITFKVQASADLNLRMDLYDIQGKCSNQNSPKYNLLATPGGVDVSDASKWLTVTFSWGGDVIVDAYTYGMSDMYSESWWGIDNIGLRDEAILLNASKIVGVGFTIDDADQGIDGEQKTIYIKDVIIGASEDRTEYYRDSITLSKIQLHNLIEVDEYNAYDIYYMVDNGTIEVGFGANQVLPLVYNQFLTHWSNAQDVYYNQTATLEENQIAYDNLQNSINQILDKYFYLTVSTTGIGMDYYNNGVETFTINSNTTWEISGIEPWFTVSQVSGFGNQTIQIMPTNNSGLLRSSSLIISSAKGDVEDVYIYQRANENGPCSNSNINTRIIGDTVVCTNSDQTMYTVYELGYYPSTYIWTVSGSHINYSLSEDNTSARYVDWSENGTDTITLHETTWDGCEDFDTLIVRIEDCLFNRTYKIESLELQYNSEIEALFIKGLHCSAIASIIDVLGENVITKQIQPQESISIELLPKGVYVIKVEVDNKITEFKIVK